MKMIRKVAATFMAASIAATMLSGCSGVAGKTEEMKKTTVESFDSIAVDVDVATVDIIPEADEFAVEYHIVNQTVEYSLKDGKLTINAENRKQIGVNNNGPSYIKIYVPEDSTFAAVSCEGDAGNINIENITADDVTIGSDVGNVTLSDITVQKSLSVETSVGNIEVTLANDDCSYSIGADIGKVVICGKELSGIEVNENHTSKTGPQVTITTATGNISFDYNVSAE